MTESYIDKHAAQFTEWLRLPVNENGLRVAGVRDKSVVEKMVADGLVEFTPDPDQMEYGFSGVIRLRATEQQR